MEKLPEATKNGWRDKSLEKFWKKKSEETLDRLYRKIRGSSFEKNLWMNFLPEILDILWNISGEMHIEIKKKVSNSSRKIYLKNSGTNQWKIFKRIL